ncbi:MAG: flagellin [Desulfobacterales bacterium]|nr:flagellin [Desulfobacterales bacterium]
MGLVVNTNIASLNAQRNLGKTSTGLNRSLQRLSSGLRINSAKDDAAGSGISNRMSAQVRGYNQAVRNANDGISLSQTAEGALQEVTTNLQRMRELAVQAASEMLTDDDRSSIQLEVDQLRTEIDRIAETTTFNNKNILNGSFAGFAFQVGANANETIGVNLESVRTNKLGKQAGIVQSTSDRIALTAAAGDTGTIGIQEGQGTPAVSITTGDATITIENMGKVDIAHADFGGSLHFADYASLTDKTDMDYGKGIAKDIAARINNIRELNMDDSTNEGHTLLEGVYASAQTTFKSSDLSTGDVASTQLGVEGYKNVGTGTIEDDGLQINGVKIGPTRFEKNDADGSLQGAINSKTYITGVKASINKDGELLLTAEDGRDILISTKDARTSNLLFGGGGHVENGQPDTTDFTAAIGALRVTGKVTITAQDSMTLVGAESGFTNLDESNVQALGSISNADVSSVKGANTLIQSVDSALKQVDDMRSNLGAVQNRLESTINNLSNISENLSASRSRILDVDFAEETASLTKTQIMQQAGTAMLAQSNQIPQAALSLLGG